MVDTNILSILRSRFEDCSLYEAPDVDKCQPLWETYDEAATNWFIKCKSYFSPLCLKGTNSGGAHNVVQDNFSSFVTLCIVLDNPHHFNIGLPSDHCS